MKYLTILVGLLLMISLVSGCVQVTEENTDGDLDNSGDVMQDDEINNELDDTYVENGDLDVGELF